MDIRNVEDIYPLSYTQQAMLMDVENPPESSAHTGLLFCAMHGDIDFTAYSSVWQQVIDRHAVLRTSFIWRGVEQPIQIVQKRVEAALDQIDLRNLTPDEQAAQLKVSIREQREEGINPTSPPLIRLVLFRTGEAAYELAWSYHRLILDESSLFVILKEVSALYARIPDSHEPSRPYSDYIAWLNQQDPARAGEHWQGVLEGFSSPTALENTTAFADLGKQDDGMGEQSLRLSQPASDLLASSARKFQLNSKTVLQGVWALLLSRYSGQKDVIYGATVSTRSTAQGEGPFLIGPYSNTLPMRVRIIPEAPALSWLKSLQEQQNELRQYSFTSLQQVVPSSRGSDHRPLFESRIVLDDFSLNGSLQSQNGGLEIRDIRLYEPLAPPLTLRVMDGRLFAVQINYDHRRFDDGTVSRMLQHLQCLLEGLAVQPDTNLSALGILREQELRQVLIDWNETQRAYPRDASIHQLFEAQAEQTPGAVALILGDQQLSYAELNRRANQLAHHLRTLGIGPDVPVGVCIGVSFEMIISLLAVLKAGGAYVPLDPTYPLNRLAFMLEDIQAPVILTERRFSEELPAGLAQVICLDSDWDEITSFTGENLPDRAAADNLAYMMYTSGSTGLPRAVSITHRGVVRLIKETNYVNLNAEEVLLQLALISFDASTFEIWGSLLNGGRLVLMPVQLPSLEEIGEAIRRYEVTTMWLTAGLFHLIVDERVEVLKPLRQLLAGGDVLSVQHVLKVLGEIPGCRLINGYGPTESTTFACCYSMAQAADVTSSVPIGRPISNTEVYLLDRDFQPVPVRMAGELFIGGDGLARCYHNRPDLTAERFVPNPFGEEPGERLYRTGDLARYLPDGIIEFLGRMDNQVKIRGFRVEPGEIEAALSRHPAVREAIVVARQDERGEKRLVGYIVLHEEQECSSDELRRYVKERLPDYMVPTAFVKLDALPLNPNGKVDRLALPQPHQELEDSFIPPSTPIEEILAEIWISVLGIERAGIHDSFFDLGGDSIRSIQVRARAQQRGLDFSIQQIFEHQTIYELAKEVRIADSNTLLAQETVPFSLISEGESQQLGDWVEDAYPMTLLQAGMLFHSEFSPETTVYHDIFSFHMQASLDLPSLRASITRLMSEHGVLRTSFDQISFSVPMQLVHQAVEIPLYVTDLTTLSTEQQEEALAQWLTSESNNPFDSSKPPLLRFYAHHRSENSFQFGVSFHHAILDGWSFASMMTELFQLYTSLIRNEGFPALLPPKATFQQYVALEQAALASEESKHFWGERLSDYVATKLPRWPSSYRMKNDDTPVLAQNVPISPETSEGLKQLAHSAGVPIKSVLLASHLRVLSLLSGTSDILTGMVTNGRPEGVDGERVLGLFLNTLPFRLNLPGGSWLDLVKETFRAELAMIPFRHYPLAQIQVNQGRQSLFETGFNFTHYHVYKKIRESDDVNVIDQTGMSQTNLTFWACFNLDLVSSEVTLELTGAAEELSKEQLMLIAGYYERALETLASNPHQNYNDCDLLSEQERSKLLVEWNDTRADYPQAESINQLFEAQVERAPDSIAVACASERLTFQGLNRRANQLARHLMLLGVGPETAVGICLERSAHLLVGLLGVLKAGGAYLPIDPAYPVERIAFMLDDTRATVLLTQQSLLAGLRGLEAKLICIDSDYDGIAPLSERNPAVWADPGKLAYVIYTSGSTGKPKGVAIEHSSLANLAHWHNRVYSVGPSDRASQMAAISFDASVWEVWPYLIAGASLHPAEEEVRLNPLRLPEWFDAQGITIGFLPTPLAEAAMMQQWPSELSLRTLLTGGDKLHLSLKEGLPFKLINHYGPTENTVVATCAEVSAEVSPEVSPEVSVDEADSTPPIGTPIDNTEAYILNEYLLPCPVGVAGELHIGGAGLARCYVNRPALTAERFIPNPFGDSAGARLYKTGDLARFLPGGDIEFLGRLDHQVKIRGFRIELGEIESVLRNHAEVREAVVLDTASSAGDKQLIAYVVASHEASLTAEILRSYLREKLPDNMIPAAFVFLNALPLTPNGKIDRRALREMEASKDEYEREVIAPRDLLEFQLIQIWESLLDRRPISTTDNFFDLGGHSLLAIRLMARIENLIGRKFPVATLFQSPTVEHLARLLRQQTISSAISPLVLIQPRGTRRPFFCVHPAGGNVFCYADLANQLGVERPFYGIQAHVFEGQPPPLTRIEEMSAEYVESLLAAQPEGPFFIGGWSIGGVVAFDLARRLREQGREIKLLVLLDSMPPTTSGRFAEGESESLLVEFCRDIGLHLNDFMMEWQELGGLEPDHQLALILDGAKKANIVPPDVSLSQVSRLFDVFKANVNAARNYTPQIDYGRVTLFRASEGIEQLREKDVLALGQHTSPLSAGSSSAIAARDVDLGWNKFVKSGPELRIVPGNHYTMLKPPHLQTLAETLNQCIREAEDE